MGHENFESSGPEDSAEKDTVIYESELKEASWAGEGNRVFTYVKQSEGEGEYPFEVGFGVEDKNKFNQAQGFSPEKSGFVGGWQQSHPDVRPMKTKEEAIDLAQRLLDLREEWMNPEIDHMK